MFLRGLQQDKLGQGNVVVINSRITNNTAGFGGAVACGSCRAAFYKTTISGNSASLRPIPAAATYSNSSAACGSGFSNSSSNETCLAAAAAGPLKQQQSDAAMALMNDIVKGAGGAVAAILAGKSFIRVCGAPNGKQAAMTDNSAATVGGLVYMSYQGEQGCDSSSGATAQYGCEENPRAQVGTFVTGAKPLTGCNKRTVHCSLKCRSPFTVGSPRYAPKVALPVGDGCHVI